MIYSASKGGPAAGLLDILGAERDFWHISSRPPAADATWEPAQEDRASNYGIPPVSQRFVVAGLRRVLLLFTCNNPASKMRDLPEGLANIYVHVTGDVGMLDEFGSLGVNVDSSGAFEGPVQPGRYRLTVLEIAPPEGGFTRVTKRFASTEITVWTSDIDGLEIQVNSPTANRTEGGTLECRQISPTRSPTRRCGFVHQ